MQPSETTSFLAVNEEAPGGATGRLYADQVDQLYRLSRPGYTATLAIAAVVAVALWGVVPVAGLVSWVVAVAAVTAARYGLYRAYIAAAPVGEPRRWARRFVAGAAVMGLAWSVLGTALFPTDHLPYQLLVVFAVGGVSIVGVVILAPLPRAFLAFMLPAALPMVAMVALQNTAVHWFMGIMMLAFCGLMAGLSPLVTELVRSSLAVKLENADLVGRLADSNERLRAANQQLSARAENDRRNAEALRETSQKLEALIDASPLAIIIRDAEGRIEKWNPAAERIFGWSEMELRGKVVPWYPSGLEDEGTLYRARILRGEAFSNVEAVRLRKDGTAVSISISGAALHDPAGRAIGVVVIVADITARKHVERRMQTEHDITHVLAESRSVSDAIPAVLRTVAESTGWDYAARWELDRDTRTLHCAETWHRARPELDAFEAYNRARVQAVDGTNGLIHRVWHSNSPEWLADLESEKTMRRAASAMQAGLRSAFAFPVRIGDEFYGVMEFFGPSPREPETDLMELVRTTGSQIGQFLARKAAEQDLQFFATHDALTGLPNRRLFGERLSHALVQAQRYSRRLAVLFVDLDGFKAINDRMGHDAGDVFLREAAGRLRARLREGDIIGRLGGDEFVVLIEEFADREQLAGIARAALDALAQPALIRGRSCRVTASIGVSTYPQDGRDSETLLKNADSAMYRAKEAKNRVHFYSG